jgi:hypothetical protein
MLSRSAKLLHRIMERETTHTPSSGGRGGRGGRGGHSGGKPKTQAEGGEFSHFLAYPLWDKYSEAMKVVQDKFSAFVATNYPQHVKDYRFQSFKCLHLTICMLHLDDANRKALAAKTLAECSTRVKEIAAGGLKVRLSDVQTFKDSNDNRVFFLDIDTNHPDFHKFIAIEDCVIRAFQAVGLIPNKKGGKEHLLLSKDIPPLFHTVPHATFLRVGNYVTDRNFQRNILPNMVKKFNEAHLPQGFGEISIDNVDICIRWDFNDKGQYNHLQRIPLA